MLLEVFHRRLLIVEKVGLRRGGRLQAEYPLVEATVEAGIATKQHDERGRAQANSVLLLEDAFVQRKAGQNEVERVALRQNRRVLQRRTHRLDHAIAIRAQKLQLVFHGQIFVEL